MSFQITISPKDKAAGRFVSRVRRALQKALAEEAQKTGITQSDLARAIGVNRSVISREVRGHKDLTLSRVAEIAWALGRKPSFELPESKIIDGSNVSTSFTRGISQVATATTSTSGAATRKMNGTQFSVVGASN